MRRSFVALAAPVFAAPVIAVSVATPLITAVGGSSAVAGGKPSLTHSVSAAPLAFAKPNCGRRWN